jgi:recombination protein RecA
MGESNRPSWPDPETTACMGPENSPRKPLVRGPCPPGGRAAGHDGLEDDNGNDDNDDSDDGELWPCMGKCKGTGGSGPARVGRSRRPLDSPPLPNLRGAAMPTQRPTRAAPGWDRQRALAATIVQVERRFGAGAVWRLAADQPIQPVPVISTGSLALDLALGVRGLPRGRISEVYGQAAAGKTTLALSVIAQAQRSGGTALFVDAEHALDLAYAQAVGVDLGRLLVCQPDCGEHALEVVDTLVRSGALAVAVIDSAPALVPRVELDGEVGDHYTGAYGLLMAQAMRKLAGPLAKSGTTLVLVNQLRDNPAVLFANPERVPGGRAIKHHAAVRLDLRRIEAIKDADGQVIGDRIRARVVKNKVAAPFRAADLDLLFGQGIDRAGELLDLGLTHGLIKRTTAGYCFGSSRLGAGREDARRFLRDHPDLADRLHTQLIGALPRGGRAA